MTRAFYMLLATIIYFGFLATFLYLIGFVARLPQLPTNVDKGLAGPAAYALAIDVGLIAIFGLQHSVMARPGFKAMWTRIVPKPIERAIYVLFASLALILLFALWHPIAGNVWHVDSPIGRVVLWGVFGAGWVIVLLSTFMISHFELFGLTQAFLHWRQRLAPPAAFRVPFFYKFVRHPLYAGFFLAFWAAPTMSYSHLLLAIGMSTYMLIAIPYEERDLIDVFGDEYRNYRAKVGGLVPKVRR
ncbi:MAG TPA: isoprenylcysteine carboxylmethyltransferase family protein [Sphingomonas sp.]|nr:isoprenylcysteine carboxylmethyltransferase family protein [Sphingomonas sp.]